jgi:CBS domain containing-hemolysin-like protein
MANIIGWISQFLLLVVAIFLAIAETSLLAVNPIRVRRMVDDEVPRAKTLSHLLEEQSKWLPTILFLTLVTQLSASAVASTLAFAQFRGLGAAIATGIVTFILFIYAEMVPKTYAVQNAEKVALRVAYPILILTRLTNPLVRLLIAIADLSSRIVGIKRTARGPMITEKELITAVSVGEEEGVIEEEEKKMIHHIFEFGDTIVREVMTPRPDMVVLSDESNAEEALSLILKEGHSRIPMYKENVDNIVGVLYARDLLEYMRKKEPKPPLREMIRPALFVPETKRVSELLRELQRKKIHMAIVVDEYGSTAGLATIEDLLEEIVGEIYDEYDLEEKMFEPISQDKVRVDARMSIDEINERVGVDLSNTDVDTVGGLIFELTGRVPKEGEEVKLKNLNFKVEKVTGRRISKVLITKLPPEEESEE